MKVIHMYIVRIFVVLRVNEMNGMNETRNMEVYSAKYKEVKCFIFTNIGLCINQFRSEVTLSIFLI